MADNNKILEANKRAFYAFLASITNPGMPMNTQGFSDYAVGIGKKNYMDAPGDYDINAYARKVGLDPLSDTFSPMKQIMEKVENLSAVVDARNSLGTPLKFANAAKVAVSAKSYTLTSGPTPKENIPLNKIIFILDTNNVLVNPGVTISSAVLDKIQLSDGSYKYFSENKDSPEYLGFDLLNVYQGILSNSLGGAIPTLQSFRDSLNVSWDVIDVSKKDLTDCKVIAPGAQFLAEGLSQGKIPGSVDLTVPRSNGGLAGAYGILILGNKISNPQGVRIISLVSMQTEQALIEAINAFCRGRSSYVYSDTPLKIALTSAVQSEQAILSAPPEGIAGALYTGEKDWSIRMYFVAGLSISTSTKKVYPVWGTYNAPGWTQTVDEFKFGVNPDTWSVQATKKVTVYKTLNRVVEEHYGDDLDTITFSGSSLSVFFGTDGEGLVKSNYKHTGVLKGGTLVDGEARKGTAAYKNMQELTAFIRSNGLSYYGLSRHGQAARARKFYRKDANGTVEAPRHPRYGMIQARFIVALEYDHTKYLGHFESFDITEDAEKPYSYTYSATFKVEKSIMI